MAYIYMMAVECENEIQCRNLASWWEQHKAITLSSGEKIICDTEVSKSDNTLNWWFSVYPLANDFPKHYARFPSGGPTSEKDAQEMNELTNIFYNLLRQRSDFRFGAADIEVVDFNNYENVSQEGFWTEDHSNIIISNEMWEKIKSPSFFQRFSKSHMWIPNKNFI